MTEDDETIHVCKSEDKDYPIRMLTKHEGFVDNPLCDITVAEAEQLAHDLLNMVENLRK